MSKDISIKPKSNSVKKINELPTITGNFELALNRLFECTDLIEELNGKVCKTMIPKLDKAIAECKEKPNEIQALIIGNFSTTEHLLQQLEIMKSEFEKKPNSIISIH